MSAPPQYVSLERAAARFDMSIKSIRRFIERGELTGYRVGKRMLRVEMAELESLLKPVSH